MMRGRGRGRGGRGGGGGGGGGSGGGWRQRAPDSTTQLPAALRKELGIQEPAAATTPASHGRLAHFQRSARGRPHTGGVLGRKEARKEARAAKKGPAPAKAVKPRTTPPAASASASASASIKRKLDSANGPPSSTRAPASKTAAAAASPAKKVKLSDSNGEQDGAKKKKKKEKKNAEPAAAPAESARGVQRKHVDASAQTPLERMLARQQASGSAGSAALGSSRLSNSEDGVPKRKKRSKMTQAEKDEEDEIAWLEAKLGMQGASGGEGDDEEGEDGLGGLIRELDRYQTGMFEQSDNEDTSRSDESDESASGSDDGSDEDTSEDESEDFDAEDDEEDGDVELNTASDAAEQAAQADSAAPAAVPADTGKYVPPALRRAAAEAAANVSGASSTSKPSALAPAVDPKLQRNLNGLLNRLSSANLDAIMAEILDAYGSFPRAVVTQTLVRLVLETVALQPNLVDNIVILYAALFCALGRSVGVEFGAEAVQVLAGRLVHAHAQLRSRQQGTQGGQVDVDDKAGRECLNLTVLLAHTYNLRLVAAPLVYDIVRLCLRDQAAVRAARDLELVHLRSAGDDGAITRAEEKGHAADQEQMQEIDVELLLKLVKACGSQLRADDPTALRDIVTLTQERVGGSEGRGGGVALGSRARFMLEALTDLQKARSKSKAGAAAFGADGTVAAEALARYKKYIASLAKRPDRLLRSSAASGVSSTDEPLLNIGLRDLADSMRKGRWWLVGAAWTGHDDEDDADAAAEGVTAKRKLLKKGETQGIDGGVVDAGSHAKSRTGAGGSADTSNEAALLLLAREHGMNTDARRSVFITLMSSEDFVDASQRLLGLGLNEVQRREVVRVLLHCLGSEPVYNPYYVLIGQQLASESGAAGGPTLATSSTSNVISTRVTMQYCLWDYFREIGESDVGGASMLASGQSADDEDEDEFKGFDDAFGETAGAEASTLGAVSRKSVHLARAYGWWMGKGVLNLNILRTVNFAALKQRGRAFVQLLLVHMLLSIQTVSPTKTLTLSWSADKAASRHRPLIENSLVRGTAGNLELARGLLIFVKRHMRPAELVHVMGGAGLKKGTRQALEWAVKVTEEVLEVGIQVAGQV